MRCAFRVDSGFGLGIGHLKRCIALAKTLRDMGAQILFICRAHDGHATHLLSWAGFDFVLLPLDQPKQAGQTDSFLGASWEIDASQTREALRRWSYEIDWLVVDHYSIDKKWHVATRFCTDYLAIIDDEGDRQYDCDVLINPLGDAVDYTEKVPHNCIIASGLDYSLLDPEYKINQRKLKVQDLHINRIFLFFGGSDKPNLTWSFLKLLTRIIPEYRGDKPVILDVVTGSANKNASNIEKYCKSFSFVNYFHDLPSLLPLLEKTDVAIGGGGNSVFERLYLGIYSYVVLLANNQKLLASIMYDHKAIHLFGTHQNLDWNEVERNLILLLCNGLTTCQLEACRGLVDGCGTERVAHIFSRMITNINCKLIDVDDEALLLAMANDPHVRYQSFSQKPISVFQHAKVFADWLNNRNIVRVYIMRDAEGSPIGQTRFEKKDGSWHIDYSLVQNRRGQGMGKVLLRYGIRRLWRAFPDAQLKAVVKKENITSIKVFENLQFDCVEETKDLTYFSLQPLPKFGEAHA